MSTRPAREFAVLVLAVLCAAFWRGPTAMAQDEPVPPMPAEEARADAESPKPEEVKVLTIEDMLRVEIERLQAENQSLREKLARAQLDGSQAARERDELRQFLADHQQLGENFEKYQGMLALKEDEARRQRAEEYREKLRQRDEERKARIEAAKAERDLRDQRQADIRKYERGGFYHVGNDVFVSAMAYLYKKENVPDTSYRFAPLIRFDGTFFFTRYWQIDYDEEIDYTTMTISGSVLNASPESRNIGVAITFYDQYGNQVGGKSVEIENARKDAPYPFTATLDMALDRPFRSYRIIVLYADPVDSAPKE